MNKKILIISLIFIFPVYGQYVLESQEREMLPHEKHIIELIEKYHTDEKFDPKVISLRNTDTKTKLYTSIIIKLKSLTRPNDVYEFNAKTRFIHYSSRDGKASSVDGFFSVSDKDLFKYERTCGLSSCESIIYKNGKKIY